MATEGEKQESHDSEFAATPAKRITRFQASEHLNSASKLSRDNVMACTPIRVLTETLSIEDSPIIGVAHRSLSSSSSKLKSNAKRFCGPCSGESVLRCQVKSLLEKQGNGDTVNQFSSLRTWFSCSPSRFGGADTPANIPVHHSVSRSNFGSPLGFSVSSSLSQPSTPCFGLICTDLETVSSSAAAGSATFLDNNAIEEVNDDANDGTPKKSITRTLLFDSPEKSISKHSNTTQMTRILNFDDEMSFQLAFQSSMHFSNKVDYSLKYKDDLEDDVVEIVKEEILEKKHRGWKKLCETLKQIRD